jgi:hypothetical protein
MTKKSGTYEEYERPRVCLKQAGRLLNGILLECLMIVKIGGAFDGDGHIRPPLSLPFPVNGTPAGGLVTMEANTLSESLLSVPGPPHELP